RGSTLRSPICPIGWGDRSGAVRSGPAIPFLRLRRGAVWNGNRGSRDRCTDARTGRGMSLVVRQARVRAIGWLALSLLLAACTRGGSPTGTAPLILTATVTRPAQLTTVAIGGPGPSVTSPTSPPAPPTATVPPAP